MVVARLAHSPPPFPYFSPVIRDGWRPPYQRTFSFTLTHFTERLHPYDTRASLTLHFHHFEFYVNFSKNAKKRYYICVCPSDLSEWNLNERVSLECAVPNGWQWPTWRCSPQASSLWWWKAAFDRCVVSLSFEWRVENTVTFGRSNDLIRGNRVYQMERESWNSDRFARHVSVRRTIDKWNPGQYQSEVNNGNTLTMRYLIWAH